MAARAAPLAARWLLCSALAAGLLAIAAASRHYPNKHISSQHSFDPSDCSRHEMLYGQIHQDLMPFALKGFRPQNMRTSRELCDSQSGLFTCVLVEDGQVGAAVTQLQAGECARARHSWPLAQHARLLLSSSSRAAAAAGVPDHPARALDQRCLPHGHDRRWVALQQGLQCSSRRPGHCPSPRQCSSYRAA